MSGVLLLNLVVILSLSAIYPNAALQTLVGRSTGSPKEESAHSNSPAWKSWREAQILCVIL